MRTIITFLVCITVSNTCFAEVHHVPADFPTIQYAVDAALDGDEIIVAPGTYTSTEDEVVDMRGKEIWLHSSGGAEVTLIDGESARRGILCDNNETNKTIIEGFTITNGYSDGNGGGMYNYGSSPTVENCVFMNNTADSGGGMCNYYDNSPTLTNCTFIGNTVYNFGGGMYNRQTSPVLENCTFENNTADANGGGISNYIGSSPTLTNCTFTGNATGMYSDYGSNPTLTDCIFTKNSGSGMYCRQASITGCDFFQNTASEGGGIYSYGSDVGDSPTITNSNFCENDPDAIYGNWNNGGGNEFLNTCGDIQGACCVKDTCYEVELIFCEALDGEWLGYNATCQEDSCVDPPQYGACCINGEAIPLFDYDCDRILGTFMGKGTNPDDVTCPVHCAEDVTGDGVVDVSDLLAIIAVWGACP